MGARESIETQGGLTREGKLLCIRAGLPGQSFTMKLSASDVLGSVANLFPEYHLEWEMPPQHPMPTLSIAMMVKNEEKFLPQCLESIKGLADELVIIDTGSTDKTVGIARRYTDKVFFHPWENDFSKGRNQSLSHCTGEWVLYIDADEELTRDSRRVLRDNLPRIASDPSVNAVSVTILNESPNGYLSRNFYPRLFRRAACHFAGIVHNQLIHPGKKVGLPGVEILHHGYNLSPEEMDRKRKTTEGLLEKQLESDRENPFPWRSLIHSHRNRQDWDFVFANAHQVLDNPRTENAEYQTTSLDLAVALHMTNQHEKGIAVALRALEKHPKNGDMLWALAWLHKGNEETEKAVGYLRQFLALARDEEMHGPSVNRMSSDSFRSGAKAQQLLAAWSQDLSGRERIQVLSHCMGERNLARRKQWGDYWVKDALDREFTRLGLQVVESDPDVTVHLFGLPLRRRPLGKRNIVWIYSHPDLVTPTNLRCYDRILVQSEAFASKLRAMGYENVAVLEGATGQKPVVCDIERDIVFVGNTRADRMRKVMADLGDTPYDLKVWGRSWEKLLPAKSRGGTYYPNEKLNELYASSRISLCDHKPEMAQEGFISVRIMDILAGGGFAISDQNAAIEGVFGDTVPQYRDAAHLKELIAYYINHPKERHELRKRGQEIALKYTWQRAAKLLLEMRPRVLYVDTLSTPNAASNVKGMGDAYRKVATTREFDYRGLTKKHGPVRMNEMLLATAVVFRPDLVHLGKCESVKGSTVKAIKEAIETTVVHFYGDFRLSVQPWVVDIGKYADYMLLQYDDEGHRAMYRKAGVTAQMGYWLGGSDPKVFYPRNMPKTYDVAFMGTNWKVLLRGGYKKRRQLLQGMLDAGLDVHIFGKNWEYLKETYPGVHLHPFITNGDELAEAYSRSKVVLGTNDVNNVRLRTSWRRPLDAMGSGAFHLAEYVPGLETLFENRKHLGWWKTVPEAIDLVRYYLTHEDERERIAAAGSAEVLANHNWDNRIAQMMAHIRQPEGCANYKDLREFRNVTDEEIEARGSTESFRKEWAKTWDSKPRTTPAAIRSAYNETDGYLYRVVYHNHHTQQRKFAALAEAVRQYCKQHPAPVKLLDYGCGTACLVKRLLGIPGLQITLADIPSRTLDFARWRYRDEAQVSFIEIHKQDCLDQTYDIMLCYDVLEHIPEPMPVMKHLAQHHKPGGLLFLFFCRALPVADDLDKTNPVGHLRGSIAQRDSVMNYVSQHYNHLGGYAYQKLTPGLKLHLGCGTVRLPGYVNIDKYNPKADRVMDAKELDYSDNSVDEIYSSHMIEHVGESDFVAMLVEWKRILKENGRLTIRCPDALYHVARWLQGDDAFRHGPGLNCILGMQNRGPGYQNHNLFTRDYLRSLVEQAGFDVSLCVCHDTRSGHRAKGDLLCKAHKPFSVATEMDKQWEAQKKRRENAGTFNMKWYEEHPITQALLRGGVLKGKVLDIGCGSGHRAKIASDFAECTILGIDGSRQAVKYAREQFQSERLCFRQGDIRAMPFEDNSFDNAYMLAVIEHVRDTDALLKEVSRVLVPGGRLFLSVTHNDYHGCGEHVHSFSVAKLLSVVAQRFAIEGVYVQDHIIFVTVRGENATIQA